MFTVHQRGWRSDLEDDVSDEVLVEAVKLGDRAAFGALYARHAGIARGVARTLSRSEHDADDLVSEAFVRVFHALERGGGPRERFRSYVLMAVRNTAYDRTRRDRRISFHGDLDAFDDGVHTDDPVVLSHERAILLRALGSLPERWQRILRYTEVEGMKPAAAGKLMDLSPNATAALAMRAREGLRQAYLQAHLAKVDRPGCRFTHDRLGAWTRRALARGDTLRVRAHLDMCERCTALARELDDVNRSSAPGRNAPDHVDRD
ncbi:MAG: sigma-70 family RNA polymerase sigma factor [Actinomycetota bacterium]|nr:sigma-70 family RNA polymerase sigma factor [Actinomycetota bacterium]